MPTQNVDDLPSLPRMAPVEHRRNLHEEAASVLPENRTIRRKDDLLSTVRSLNDQKAKKARASSKTHTTGTLASLARTNAGKDSQSNRNIVKRRGVDVQNAKPLDGVDPVGMGYGPGLLPYERKPLDNTSKTIIDLENEVNTSSQRYNKMKQQTIEKSRKAAELSARLDTIRNANSQLQPESTPEMRRTKELEEATMQKKQQLAEAEFRYSQLEHMASRLKRNHIAFDGHLRMMDEAIGVAEKEHHDVQTHLLSLNKAKDESATALNDLEKEMARKEEERSTELGKRREELKIAKKAESWRKKRQDVRAELEAKLLGGLTKSEEKEMLESCKEKESQYNELLQLKEEREQKANELYDMFYKIKQQTGIETLNEMSRKFLAQKEARENLEYERDEAEHRLQEAKEGYRRAQLDLQAIEASGGPHDNATESKGEVCGEYNTISGAREALGRKVRVAREQANSKYATLERLSRALVIIRQGSSGLIQNLRTFEDLLPNNAFSRQRSADSVELDFDDLYNVNNISIKGQTEETIQILYDIQACVSYMKRAIREEAGRRSFLTEGEEEQVESSPVAKTEQPTNINNIRVRPGSASRIEEPEEEESDRESELSQSSDPYTTRGRTKRHERSPIAHERSRAISERKSSEWERHSLKQGSSRALHTSGQDLQSPSRRSHFSPTKAEKENDELASSSIFSKGGPSSPMSYLTSRPPLI